MAFVLPDLPYPKDAFGDILSAETFDYHHGKHHNAYVVKANELIAADPAQQGKSLVELIKSSKGALFNQVGQIWNHTFYWHSLSPEKKQPSGQLLDLINEGFGSATPCRCGGCTAASGTARSSRPPTPAWAT